jgi:hypothetical protein
MQQKVLEHAGNSNRHGAAALPGSKLVILHRGRHAVDIILDIGNIMHYTMSHAY